MWRQHIGEDMKKHWIKRGAAMLLGTMLAVQVPLGTATPIIDSYAATGSATVNASSLNVRSGPGTNHSQVAKLAQGTAVTVLAETTGSDGKLWYQIRFSGSGGAETTGYALGTYIKFPVTYQKDADFEAYLNAQGFPESYKNGLRELHAQYPNWVFQAQHTGLEWNTVIDNQGLVGRNLVWTSSVSSWKSTKDGAYDWGSGTWPGFDGASWVAASDDIIRYYMDPRNFLDNVYVFQFLSHTYDSSVHTRDGMNLIISGTFLDNGSGEGSSTGSPEDNGSSSPETGSSNTGTTGSTGATEGYGPGYPSGGSSTGNHGSTGSTGETAGVSPTGGSDDVRLEGPSASIIKNQVSIASTSNYGPGVTGGSAPGNTPPGNTSPGGTSEPGGSGGGGSSYVDIIMNAAQQSGVNPYVLAAMIIQEQGRKGTSDSISGTHSSYPGYYNFFNIGAYQSGSNSAVTQGLVYASQSGSYNRPWNSREASIVGGAIYYGENYVKAGQDTFYLKKFNVQGTNLYKHQYMTNVQGAASEAALYAEAYTAQLRQNAMVFKIPVYQNMPENACARPTLDGSPNNKLSGLSVEGFSLTPTFNRDVNSYDLIVDHSVSSVNVAASVIDSKATAGGTGSVSLQDGRNEIRIQVTAENGNQREYVINVVRQINGPTYHSGTGSAGGTDPGIMIDPGASGPGGGNTDSGGTGASGPGGDDVIVISPVE